MKTTLTRPLSQRPTDSRAAHHLNGEKFGQALACSLIFHAALFIALAVRAVFFPSEPSLIENAIHVDIVALPDKRPRQRPVAPAAPPQKKEPVPVETRTQPPPPEPEPAAPVAPNPPKPALKAQVHQNPEAAKANLNQARREQQAALKRLEALQRIEKMAQTQQPAADTDDEAPSESEVIRQPIQGNAVVSGTDLRGVARLDHQAYLGQVEQKAKRHWNLPHWLAGVSLRARLRLYIDSQGYVVKKEVIQTSGNSAFDDTVILAVESASPFNPPPDHLANILAVEGVEIDFSPQ